MRYLPLFAAIEKSGGCNHITCTRCNTDLCYQCSKMIKHDEVLDHYKSSMPCRQFATAAAWDEDEAKD
jgi:hypothetical protein